MRADGMLRRLLIRSMLFVFPLRKDALPKYTIVHCMTSASSRGKGKEMLEITRSLRRRPVRITGQCYYIYALKVTGHTLCGAKVNVCRKSGVKLYCHRGLLGIIIGIIWQRVGTDTARPISAWRLFNGGSLPD